MSSLAFGFRGFFLLGLFFLLFALELVADQFKDGHFGAVTDADAGGDNPRVAPRAVREFRRDLAEELLRDARRHDIRRRLPARFARGAPPQLDHLLRYRPRRPR